MAIFLIWLFLTLCIGAWANSMNRSFFGWFLISFFFSPIIGAIALLIFGAKNKTCPKCAETVKVEAKICKHCSFNFELQSPSPKKSVETETDPFKGFT